jgi:hypothetical protein
MKHTYLILAAALVLAALPARAQITSSTTTITHDSTFAQGRDFWFAEQSNYFGENLGGKYMRIYITSDENCTAFVGSGFTNGVPSVTQVVPITSHQISSFNIPLFWEVESSGIAENKVIEVWSNTSNLTVYNMSHQLYSSDGEYIIPTIGWGTDYVVAAYGALYEGNSYVFDLPSTCIVVANRDSTSVDITPSCNCRASVNSNYFFPAGQTFNIQLDRGQCVQLMSVKSESDSGFDLTGTIIHANYPVGVSGGSMEPDIPANFQYANHVEDMIPPVRTWGETYYPTNPIDSLPTHQFAQYLFISSVANQMIFRHSCDSGNNTECVIPNKYGIYWDEIAGAQKFFSDQPFLVVEYVNSSNYPDSIPGQGNPSEVRLNPREQFTKTVEFQAASTEGGEQPYVSYANVSVNINDETKTRFDGKSISSFPSQCADSSWEIFTVPNVTPGTHSVTNDDSGVGVTIYGYGLDETYSWSSPSGVATFQSPDSVAPRASISTECLESFIHLSDTGALASGLDMIRVDSIYNMNYTVDPNWLEGSESGTSDYTISVVNPSRPGIITVSVFDVAGNHTTIRSVYAPVIDSIKPPLQNLGTWESGPPKIAYDTLYNMGADAFDITELQLLNDNLGFSLFDSIGGSVDRSPVPPGQRRLIQIQFQAKDSSLVIDSILYGDSCFVQAVVVIGSGGAADFFVTSQSWPDELLTSPPTCYPKNVTIYNFSTDTLTIDKAFWKDILHFQAVSTFPVVIPPTPASKQFTIDYCPDNNSLITHDATQGSWTSPQVLEGKNESPRFDSLTGFAVAESETFVEDTIINDPCPSPSGDTAIAYFTIAATGTAPSTITIVIQSDPTDFSLVGRLDNGETWDPSTTPETLAVGQTAVISAEYVIPPGINKTVIDSLVAIDGAGDTIGGTALTVTVNGIYFAGTTNPDSLTFGPVPSQSQNPNATQKSFLITNESATSPLTIYSIGLQPGNYDSAFALSLFTIPGNAPVLFPTSSTPIILQVGQSLEVSVDFNDSLFDVATQQAQFDIETNSCPTISEILTASIAGAGVPEASVPLLNATILPAEDGSSLEIILPTDMIGPVRFQLVNVLGESVLRSTLNTGTQTVDASALPRGVYFYRLTSGQMSQSGKVILGE